MKKAPEESGAYRKMAEADENRTHLGRDAPHIGFEDRECHQSTGCLHTIFKDE